MADEPQPVQQQVQIVTCGACQKPLVLRACVQAGTGQAVNVPFCASPRCPQNPWAEQLIVPVNGFLRPGSN